jgi:outer membrane receptor for ferrienterochelin and colicins
MSVLRRGSAPCISLLLILLVSGAATVLPALARQSGTPPDADSPRRDSLWTVEMPVMVITASRTLQRLKDTPVPTRVVRSEDIRRTGSLRLTDVLSQEPGLFIVHDHGAGIQMQGMDPAYTLILIDGQPLLGRTAGTLDMDRLPVADIERLEIVQGPSSSLYGSDALAGVINIITRAPEDGLSASGMIRRQSFATTDANASVSGTAGPVSAALHVNSLTSDGYDLSPSAPGMTRAPYDSQTGSLRLDWQAGPTIESRLDIRMARQARRDQTPAGVLQDRQYDWSVSPGLAWRATPIHRIRLNGHAASFRTTSSVDAATSRFRQGMYRVEAIYDHLGSRHHLVTAGAGATRDVVRADRILGNERSMEAAHAFVQHQWARWSRFQTTASARLDAHSEYGTHVSPKLALLGEPADDIQLRVSVGSGFKAPTFQQMFMDFTNPVAGYSVVGASDVRPEQSVSWNASVTWSPVRRVDITAAAFLNRVRDLIETVPVAIKPNGQNVFTYVNLDRIRTRGLTLDLQTRPVQRVDFRAGYQLLDTADLSVLEDLDAGRVFARKDGVDYRLSRRDYGGLLNRSRHSLHAAVTAERVLAGVDLTVQGQYRSRYGHADLNGNLILDAENEYVPGHWLWNVTTERSVGNRLRLQAGIRNLFNHTNAQLIPSQPGRQVFASLAIEFQP